MSKLILSPNESVNVEAASGVLVATNQADGSILVSCSSSPPPAGLDNWLINGLLKDPITGKASTLGWSNPGGLFFDTIHDPLICDASGTWWWQMDMDFHGNDPWSVGAEDVVSTIISNPPAHNALRLRWREAHHLAKSIIRLSLFGIKSDGAEDLLYSQIGISSPRGTGKCPVVPYQYDVAIPLGFGSYPSYRLEVYGKLLHQDDGVLWGAFELTGTLSLAARLYHRLQEMWGPHRLMSGGVR